MTSCDFCIYVLKRKLYMLSTSHVDDPKGHVNAFGLLELPSDGFPTLKFGNEYF
ncbi:hypothetical protein HanIR_Chr01g0026791 [Helianthus annuus]|nr:hypothetical protein HanIR_Chr01g0026791 [Helianthus annuus]